MTPNAPNNSPPTNKAKRTVTGCNPTSLPINLGAMKIPSMRLIPPKSNATANTSQMDFVPAKIKAGIAPTMGPR